MIVNFEAEQAALGCLLVRGSLIKESKLSVQQFGDERHEIIFKAMKTVETKQVPIDLVQVVTALQEKNRLDDVGGIQYLMQLSSSVASTENFKHYEKLVFAAWKKREAIIGAKSLIESIQKGEDIELIYQFADKLMRLNDSETSGPVNKKEVLHEQLEQYGKPTLRGITTGYPDLNAMIGGFKREGGDLIILAARPSVGKTAFALNMGYYASKGGAIVPFFSLEMSGKSLFARMESSIGHIPSEKFRTAYESFEEEDWKRLNFSIQELLELPFEVYDNPSQTVQDIRAEVRKIRRENPDTPIVVMIDYLGLIKPVVKGENRNQEVAEVSRELKLIARETGSTVVALAQLNRGVEGRQDKRPMMSDIRDSGSIEQDADIVGLLFREDYYDKESENKNVIECIIAKQRNGPTGTVELGFLKEYNKFVSLDNQR